MRAHLQHDDGDGQRGRDCQACSETEHFRFAPQSFFFRGVAGPDGARFVSAIADCLDQLADVDGAAGDADSGPLRGEVDARIGHAGHGS